MRGEGDGPDKTAVQNQAGEGEVGVMGGLSACWEKGLCQWADAKEPAGRVTPLDE
jgi:hypothetical protein